MRHLTAVTKTIEHITQHRRYRVTNLITRRRCSNGRAPSRDAANLLELFLNGAQVPLNGGNARTKSIFAMEHNIGPVNVSALGCMHSCRGAITCRSADGSAFGHDPVKSEASDCGNLDFLCLARKRGIKDRSFFKPFGPDRRCRRPRRPNTGAKRSRTPQCPLFAHRQLFEVKQTCLGSCSS